MQQREKAYVFVLGQLASERLPANDAFNKFQKFLTLNPRSIVEASMSCQTSDELYHLARKIQEGQEAYSAGYVKGIIEAGGGLPLPEIKKRELKQKWAYVTSGLPPEQVEDQLTELVAQIIKLLDRGYQI